MRVLMVIGGLAPSLGGPSKVCAELSVELAHRGLEIEIATTTGGADPLAISGAWPSLTAAGVTVHLFPTVWPHSLGMSPKLNRFLAANMLRFDVLHLHGVWEQGLACAGRIARRHGRPYVLYPHGMLDRWSRARSRWKKVLAARLLGSNELLRNATALQFATAAERDEAADLGLSPPTYAIPNGIHAEAHQRENGLGLEPLWEDHPGLRGRAPVILFFSRFHPKKGLHLLLEAFARVAPRFPAAAVLAQGIPSDDTYLSALRERAQRPDLRDRVFITTRFTGPLRQVALNAADLFVLPSFQEGFSMAIMEALVCGLPTLITDRCHLDELEQRGAGLVAAPTVPDLAQALDRLLSMSPAERAATGQRAHDWAAAEFSWSSVGARMHAMYLELVRGGIQWQR